MIQTVIAFAAFIVTRVLILFQTQILIVVRILTMAPILIQNLILIVILILTMIRNRIWILIQVYQLAFRFSLPLQFCSISVLILFLVMIHNLVLFKHPLCLAASP